MYTVVWSPPLNLQGALPEAEPDPAEARGQVSWPAYHRAGYFQAGGRDWDLNSEPKISEKEQTLILRLLYLVMLVLL